MRTIEYKNIIDKRNWERGEWDNEPDKIQWQDEATGLPCLVVRNGLGNLCGYVGVAKIHPFFEKGYNDCYKNGDDDFIEPHGGLTFSGRCQERPQPGEGVCHEVEAGEDDAIWWLGFDCAHSGDYSSMSLPESIRVQFPHQDDIYRNVHYVRNECIGLAKQLADFSKESQ